MLSDRFPLVRYQLVAHGTAQWCAVGVYPDWRGRRGIFTDGPFAGYRCQIRGVMPLIASLKVHRLFWLIETVEAAVQKDRYLPHEVVRQSFIIDSPFAD